MILDPDQNLVMWIPDRQCPNPDQLRWGPDPDQFPILIGLGRDHIRDPDLTLIGRDPDLDLIRDRGLTLTGPGPDPDLIRDQSLILTDPGLILTGPDQDLQVLLQDHDRLLQNKLHPLLQRRR